MNQETVPAAPSKSSIILKKSLFIIGSVVLLASIFAYNAFKKSPASASAVSINKNDTDTIDKKVTATPVAPSLSFTEKMNHIVNGDSSGKWTSDKKEPPAGAILPYKRIVAFYGNLYSKNMGILGELPKKEMLEKLQAEAKAWHEADTLMEVQPALHYIAVTAQGSPGKGNTYRLRMPFHQLDSVLKMAAEINAIVFLDVQVGLSTLQSEIPQLEQYLKLPNVHLGIDPEFSMKTGQKPGSVIGSFNASDINYTIDYLEKIVKDNNLTPKVLIVHRFTQAMVKDYKQIKLKPEVQVVMDMDGWGFPAKKINTYKQFIYREPVEYTGFKLFYKNDTKNNGRMLTHEEVLKLKPQPVYIQYQ